MDPCNPWISNYLWASKNHKVIPSQLIAIVITLISIFFNLDVPTVSDLGKLPDGLPSISLPFGSIENGKVPFSLETLGIILPTSLAISLVGLMETFLTRHFRRCN